MSAADLERIFDAAADAVAAGQPPAEAADGWPEHAGELAPLLDTISVMAATPPPRVGTVNEQRFDALVAQLRVTPQQREPRRLPRPLRRDVRGLLPRWSPPAFAFPAAATAAATAAVGLALLLVTTSSDAVASAKLEVFAGAVYERTGDEWTRLAGAAELRDGIELRADADTSARLTFEDGSTATIAGSGALRIDRHRRGEVSLAQFGGTVEHRATPSLESGVRYSVTTTDATVTTSGAAFRAEVGDAGTSVLLIEGSATVHAGDSSVTLGAGEHVHARLQALLVDDAGGGAASPGAPAAEGLRLTLPAGVEAAIVAPDGSRVTLNALGDAGPLGSLKATPSGGLTLDLSAGVRPGTYRLVINHVPAGAAEVSLAVGQEVTVVRLDPLAGSVELELTVTAGPAGATLGVLPPAVGTDGGPASSPAPLPQATPAQQAGEGTGNVIPPARTSTPMPVPSPTPTALPGLPTVVPTEAPQLPSGVRGSVTLTSTCVPLPLGQACAPVPGAVTLVMRTEDGAEVARSSVAAGSSYEIALPPGGYRLSIETLDGVALPGTSVTPFSVIAGSWTGLDVAVQLTP